MSTEVEVEKVEVTIYDPRFELAALRGLAEMLGVPEDQFNHIMGFVVEVLTWNPGEDIKTEDVKAEVLKHWDAAITEYVLIYGSGDYRQSIPALVLIGAAMSSLLRKWHVEAHPDATIQPSIEVHAVTFEEYQEMKDKQKQQSEDSEASLEAEITAAKDETDSDTYYEPQGDEGWLEDTGRDVV